VVIKYCSISSAIGAEDASLSRLNTYRLNGLSMDKIKNFGNFLEFGDHHINKWPHFDLAWVL